MLVLFFTILTAAVQTAIYIGYPDSGRFGMAFLVFFAFGSGCYYIGIASFLSSSRSTTRLYLHIFGLLLSVLFFATFLPQTDAVPVFDKIAIGKYPAGPDIYRGLKNLGIDYPALKPPVKEIEPLEI